MAAMSLLKNLPDGYRFNPRDEDIISHYLIRKIQGTPDPDGNCFIPEIDIYEYEPQDLIALYDSMSSINSNGLECFFFCTLAMDPNRRGIKRKIAGGKKGFWHQTGEGRQPQDTDKLKWAKRIFCHRLGTHRNSEQTDWVMHEFRLIDNERFVLCRITNKPKKKLSASSEKKRKVGSSSSESHQEACLESCILTDIITKKAKKYTGPSQKDNHTPLAVNSEALIYINAPEVPTITTPFSDINMLDDGMDEFLHNLRGHELQSRWSELISTHHNYPFDMSPSVSMIGAHPPPLDINPPELPTIMAPLNEPQSRWSELISSYQNHHSNITASESMTGAHPPPLDINPPELPTIMTPLYEPETLLSYDLISTHHNYPFDMSPSVSMIGAHPPPLDVPGDGNSMFDNLFPDVDLVY